MQSDISSFGSATLNSLQAQPSSSFVAVDGNEHSLSTREHSGYLHPSVGSKGSVEGNVLDVKDNYKKSSIQAKISVKTSEIVGETTTCIGTFQQLESVGLCNQTENALPSMYTPEKKNLGGGSQTGGPKTPTEISRESTLNEAVCTVTDKLVASCGSSLVAVSSNVQRPVNACITASEPKGEQASLNYPEKQVSAKVCISPDTKSDLENGRGLRVITDRNTYKPSNDNTLSQEVFTGLGRSCSLEREGKGSEKPSRTCALPQEHSASSSHVPSSQMCVPVDQPLKGLVPEELCSSSSETSQPKGNSEESYSILQGRSSEKSSDDSIVPSSQNSHEFELEQSCALHHVTPERNQLNCSLTESQLENLFETSVSFDEGTAPPCFSDVPSPVQEGYTQIKPRNFRQRESTLSDNIPGNLKSSSRNVAVNHPCLASRQNFIVKESVTRRHSNEGFITCKEKGKENGSKHVDKEDEALSPPRGNVGPTLNRKEMENAKVGFDALFSQNTWNCSQTSADLFEIDRRQSIKRKRCAKDDCVHVTRPSDGTRRGRKALFRDSPVSPGESE